MNAEMLKIQEKRDGNWSGGPQEKDRLFFPDESYWEVEKDGFHLSGINCQIWQHI